MNEEWDKDTALNKTARFCAYQERSEAEVRRKLLTRISSPEVVDQILESLKEDDFLNEDRFLKSFIRGKFFGKKWGRIKIRYALKGHGLEGTAVENALSNLIPESEYQSAVSQLMQLKLRRLKKEVPLARKGKVFQHLAAKGYEQEVIYEAWREQGFDV